MGCSSSQSNSTVPIGNSMMHLIQSGQTDAIIKKLKNPSEQFDKNTIVNFRGDTLLHYACSKNDLKLVQFLVKKGINPNIENKQGQKAVDLATDSLIISSLQKLTLPTKKTQGEQKLISNQHTRQNTDRGYQMEERKNNMLSHNQQNKGEGKTSLHEIEESQRNKNKRGANPNIFDEVKRSLQNGHAHPKPAKVSLTEIE